MLLVKERKRASPGVTPPTGYCHLGKGDNSNKKQREKENKEKKTDTHNTQICLDMMMIRQRQNGWSIHPHGEIRAFIKTRKNKMRGRQSDGEK